MEIGIQIFEICKGGNFGVFDDTVSACICGALPMLLPSSGDPRRSRALSARDSLRNIRYQKERPGWNAASNRAGCLAVLSVPCGLAKARRGLGVAEARAAGCKAASPSYRERSSVSFAT
jgi:hypothetical protein